MKTKKSLKKYYKNNRKCDRRNEFKELKEILAEAEVIIDETKSFQLHFANNVLHKMGLAQRAS
ncbi:MAG: hypothetical protein GY909_02735 [Oligoflexia bacterium]|nr:hypothetical protein [Oligoflexia bacterium]